MQQKTVIIIAGPTAVGKTAVGKEVAKHFQAAIISADSRQCFKEMRIGVARPSAEELAQVPHHFVASHSISQKVTAATFEEYALNKAETLFQMHDTVLMVGGTGLYIKAFCEGMDEIPEVPENIHQEVIAAYQQNGLTWLQEEIQKLDPEFWKKGETKNPQRMMRALEVVKATGQSLLHFRKGEKKQRNFSVVKIGLQLPKEELHHNISCRVNKMIEEGLLEEVKTLLPYRHLNALQTVGYKEIFPCLDGSVSLEEAAEAIRKNTRQYAKRQLTWFRKDDGYKWCPPDAKKIIPFLQQVG
ncbi:MAG TPA: tRNA (adenosine(37)-N6)-dimethylallyltransferase MiaA [Flavisolibacter sp.]|nr:tRNA (adenosine(37)-N6)-dimethylallyltransferase MiaA [Flavisolibacter sp.]